MKYRLLVLDIDGTLVGKKTDVSWENKQALEGIIASGVIVSLCTGRAPQGARGVLNQLSLDGYHTFFDGALVMNPETAQEVYVQPLEITTILASRDPIPRVAKAKLYRPLGRDIHSLR